MPMPRPAVVAWRAPAPRPGNPNSRGDMRNCSGSGWTQGGKEARRQGGKVARWLIAALPLCLLASVVTAQVSTDSALPIDPAVTVGTLPNGLRYYIRVN